jgi:hypothetical protein
MVVIDICSFSFLLVPQSNIDDTLLHTVFLADHSGFMVFVMRTHLRRLFAASVLDYTELVVTILCCMTMI